MISIARTTTRDTTPPLGVDVTEVRAIYSAIGRVREELEARTAVPAVERLEVTSRASWFAVGLAFGAFAVAVVALIATLAKG